MLKEDIRVSWLEKGKVIPPCAYNENPTKAEWDKYYEEVNNKTVRKCGTIIDFTTSIFGNTKAIIDSGDNKIVKVPIEKLMVLHSKKKNK